MSEGTMFDDNEKPDYVLNWAELKFSTIRSPSVQETEIDPEILAKITRQFQEKLDDMLLPKIETTAKKRPLTIDEAVAVTYSLETPFMLCGQGDILKLSRVLRKKGFSLRRIRGAYWQAAKDKILIAIGISPIAQKGEMYVMEAALPRINPGNFFEKNIGTRPLIWGVTRWWG
jgi:hypothetical protein